MSISNETALKIVQQYAERYSWDYCHEYGEPGYNLTGDQAVVVFGDYWCRCGANPHTGKPKGYGYPADRLVEAGDLHDYAAHRPLLWKRLEEVADFNWHDEWMIDYENDKCYRTSADSYFWQPAAVYNTDTDEYMTPDDDLDTWIEWATAEPAERIIPRHIASKSDLEAKGFADYNGVYENGWHPGQTDDPKAIVKRINDEYDEAAEILFWWTESSQFYIRFEAMIRVAQRDALSSNHFSTDLQLQDVVGYLEREMPERYEELLKLFPELPRAFATITGTSSWIDCDDAGVDVEFSSWVIEWIENHTPIMWEDGEPFITLRPWEAGESDAD